MNNSNIRQAIARAQYDAVLFDLDGVITDTANLHAACWKRMFDEYLKKRAAQSGEEFRPFELSTDYLLYVMGRRALTASVTFLDHAISRFQKEPQTTRLRSKQWAGSETARMTWSTRRSRTQGFSPTMEASSSFITSAVTGSRSLSLPPAKTATPS